MSKTNKSLRKPAGKRPLKKLITRDILIGKLIEKYPQSSQVLLQHGFHCLGCMVSPYESLEAGAAVHGIPLEKLLKDLNNLVKRK
jgi:hybrid cluster-associated redox disulfide protein